jgi:hypothetical protein
MAAAAAGWRVAAAPWVLAMVVARVKARGVADEARARVAAAREEEERAVVMATKGSAGGMGTGRVEL